MSPHQLTNSLHTLTACTRTMLLVGLDVPQPAVQHAGGGGDGEEEHCGGGNTYALYATPCAVPYTPPSCVGGVYRKGGGCDAGGDGVHMDVDVAEEQGVYVYGFVYMWVCIYVGVYVWFYCNTEHVRLLTRSYMYSYTNVQQHTAHNKHPPPTAAAQRAQQQAREYIAEALVAVLPGLDANDGSKCGAVMDFYTVVLHCLPEPLMVCRNHANTRVKFMCGFLPVHGWCCCGVRGCIYNGGVSLMHNNHVCTFTTAKFIPHMNTHTYTGYGIIIHQPLPPTGTRHMDRRIDGTFVYPSRSIG